MLKDTLKQIEEGFIKEFSYQDAWSTNIDVRDILNFIKSSNNKILEAVEEEINILKIYCHNCDGTDKKYYGECKCSYDDMQLIKREDILKIISEAKR
jgi:uroporphyrinogen-III decarboxylase